jgi:ParB family chromosome partitioning protein
VANDKKKGLGRGLGALLGGASMSAPTPPAEPVEQPDATPTALTDGTRLIEIDPSTIKPNPKQPRTHFDEDALQELSESIRRDGVQEPVLVPASARAAAMS